MQVSGAPDLASKSLVSGAPDLASKSQASGAPDLASKSQGFSDSSSARFKDEIEDSYKMDKIQCPCGSTLQTESMIKIREVRVVKDVFIYRNSGGGKIGMINYHYGYLHKIYY
nr:E3 SUMO-protein ligase SIZ1-like isoform X1 [Ipomoea batatas]